MSTRIFQELKDAVDKATNIHDAATLMHCADELDTLATSEAEAVAHHARGLVQAFRGYYSAALEHFHRALAIYEKLSESSGVAGVTGNIGLVHQSTGNYPAALEHFHRALAMHEKLGQSRSVAGVTNNIGLVYYFTGNYPTALEHYYSALAVNEELGNRSWVAINTCNIGHVHSGTGNYPAALDHYHRALAMHEQLGESSSVAVNTGNIGTVYGNTGNFPAALEYLHRALALHEELGDNSNVARVTGNILSTMILSGEHTEAEALMQTMDAIQIDDPVVVITREQSRASLQEHHGDIDEARATLRAALLISQEHTLAPKQADVHRALRDLALKRNDLAGYVEHNNEYTRINEEINGKESALKMAMQEKQREIDAERKEIDKQLAVLHSTLPKHVAERVARGEVVNDHFDNASVIFLDIVGFTELSSSMSSQDVITLLENIFTQCDAICEQHNVTKIKTIGDSYMCVSFDNVTNAALCALDFSHIRVAHQRRASASHEVSDVSHEVEFRIGIHCGPLTAGVIGTARMQYDVWGDTVNVASRMESTSEPGRIHVSQAFAENLEEESRIKNQESNQESHEVSHTSVAQQRRTKSPSVAQSELVTRHLSLVTFFRGSIDIKGKGSMKTYWLE